MHQSYNSFAHETDYRQENDWRPESPWKNSRELPNNERNGFVHKSNGLRNSQRSLPRDTKGAIDSVSYNDLILDDDSSLSYYGLGPSSENSNYSENEPDIELSPTIRPRTSRSLTKRAPRQSRLSRNKQLSLISRSLNRDDETRAKAIKYSSDYEDVDLQDVGCNGTDPLDSIINKYLYRK